MLSNEATAELVVRAERGDAEAFTALARAFLRAAYAVALGIVGRSQDADDVAQDAFVLAFERLDSCREPARFGGWLLSIVRNQARNFCFPGWYRGRAVHVHVRVLTGDYDGADNAPSAAITQLLWDDAFVDAVFTDVPLYADRGLPDTHLDDDVVAGNVSDKQAFLFETQQMPDGAMLCSKTLVVAT